MRNTFSTALPSPPSGEGRRFEPRRLTAALALRRYGARTVHGALLSSRVSPFFFLLFDETTRSPFAIIRRRSFTSAPMQDETPPAGERSSADSRTEERS